MFMAAAGMEVRFKSILTFEFYERKSLGLGYLGPRKGRAGGLDCLGLRERERRSLDSGLRRGWGLDFRASQEVSRSSESHHGMNEGLWSSGSQR